MARGRRKQNTSSKKGWSLSTLLFLAAFIGILVKLSRNYWRYIVLLICFALYLFVLYRIILAIVTTIHSLKDSSQEEIEKEEVIFENSPVPVDHSKIVSELDDRIKRIAFNRKILGRRYRKIQGELALCNFPLIRFIPAVKERREALIPAKEELELEFSKNRQYFSGEETPVFKTLKQTFARLSNSADVKAYNGLPSPETLYNDDCQLEDVSLFSFAASPFYLAFPGNCYCITPNRILQFTETGKYVAVYPTDMLTAEKTSQTIRRKVEHSHWTHQRIDGGPDLRYSNNPKITSVTEEVERIEGAFRISLPGIDLRYEIPNETLEQELLNAIRNYGKAGAKTAVSPETALIRLLRACFPENEWLPEADEITRNGHSVRLMGTETQYEAYLRQFTRYDKPRKQKKEPGRAISSLVSVLPKILGWIIAILVITLVLVFVFRDKSETGETTATAAVIEVAAGTTQGTIEVLIQEAI